MALLRRSLDRIVQDAEGDCDSGGNDREKRTEAMQAWGVMSRHPSHNDDTDR